MRPTISLLILACLWLLPEARAFEALGPKVNMLSPGNQPFDGIDISKHNGVIDWDEIGGNKHVKFVYIKATEGSNYRHTHYYRANMMEAHRRGLKVGSYHYLLLNRPVKEQFEHFKTVAKKADQDLIPMIDVEDTASCPVARVREVVKEFADLVEKHYGCRPMIYTNVSYFNTRLGLAFKSYPLCIASYSRQPALTSKTDWVLWQFTDNGRSPGMREAIDLSRFGGKHSIDDIILPKGGKTAAKPAAKKAGSGKKAAGKAGQKQAEKSKAKAKTKNKSKGKSKTKTEAPPKKAQAGKKKK